VSTHRHVNRVLIGALGAACVLFGLCQGGCPGGGAPSGTTLLEQTLPASATAQRVELAGKVAVEVPPGLLKGDTLLRIGPTTSAIASDLAGIWRTIAGYNIQLGDLHDLDQDLVIEFPYDPTLVPAGTRADNVFQVAYWDPDQQAMVYLPLSVDETRHVLVARTRHLSDVYSLNAADVGIISDDQFVLTYVPSEVFAETYPAAEWYKAGDPGFQGTRDPNRPMYAEDVFWQMHDTLSTYVNVGLAQRGAPLIHGCIGGSGSASRGKLTGAIWITLDCAGGYKTLRPIVAHELFHCVQNRDYFHIGWMTLNNWWMEATAEYAACRIAYPGSGMGGDYVDPGYLNQPLNSSSMFSDHAYNTAYFIDFLVTRKGVKFVELFKKVAESWNPDLTVPIDDYLKCCGGLEQAYEEFAEWWLFDAASPVAARLQQGALPDVADLKGNIDLDNNSEWRGLEYAPSLTAKLVRVTPTLTGNDTVASVKLAERPGYVWATGAYAVLWRVPGDNPALAQRLGVVQRNGAGSTNEVQGTIYKGDSIYIQAINASNAGEKADFNLQLNLSRPTTPPLTAPFSYNNSKSVNGDPLSFLSQGRPPQPIPCSVAISGAVTYRGHAPTVTPCINAPFCVEIGGSEEITGIDMTITVSYTLTELTALEFPCDPNYPSWTPKIGTVVGQHVWHNSGSSSVPAANSGNGEAYRFTDPALPGMGGYTWVFKAMPMVDVQMGTRTCATGADTFPWGTQELHCFNDATLIGSSLVQVRVLTQAP
jgi:hypothetical protein